MEVCGFERDPIPERAPFQAELPVLDVLRLDVIGCIRRCEPRWPARRQERLRVCAIHVDRRRAGVLDSGQFDGRTEFWTECLECVVDPGLASSRVIEIEP